MKIFRELKQKHLIGPAIFAIIMVAGIAMEINKKDKKYNLIPIDDSVVESSSPIEQEVQEVQAVIGEQGNQEEQEEQQTLQTLQTLETTQQEIYVYICGAVNNPGVYQVENNSLLNDAVNIAGGLTQNAAINNINLVLLINQNMTIYIPTQDEVDNQLYTGEVVTLGSNTQNQQTGASTSAQQQEIQSSTNQQININTATKYELMSIPGVGEVTADAIINYRDEHGSFISIDELTNVDGIGEGKLNRFRDYICV